MAAAELAKQAADINDLVDDTELKDDDEEVWVTTPTKESWP